MDNPLYPPPSAGSAVTALIGMISLVVLLGLAFGIYKILRANGFLTRTRENPDSHAARTAYNQGLKDAELRAQQRQELNATQAQLDHFIETLNQVGQRLDDMMRTTNRPHLRAVVDQDNDRRPGEAARRATPAASATSHERGGMPARPRDTPESRRSHRLGLHKPEPEPAHDVRAPTSAPAPRPTPPIPAAVPAAATATQPTPVPAPHP